MEADMVMGEALGQSGGGCNADYARWLDPGFAWQSCRVSDCNETELDRSHLTALRPTP